MNLPFWHAVPSSDRVGVMNPLDIGIVALCAALGLFGLLQGFVRQAASWVGLLLGLVAGWKYGAEAQKLLRLDFSGGAVAAYLVLLLGVYIAVRLIGLLVERWVRGTKLSGADRFLGMLAGLAKGALLSVLLVFFLALLLPRDASLLKGSKISPRLMVAARWMEDAFPERIRDSFREKMRAEPDPSREKAERDGSGNAPASQPKKRSRK
jgi:membrane protein required for colicin V production